ncbi:putative spermidine/putrescine transport system substrate-binding protein [Burkholderia sp. WP9]|uniref:ABC transporter substrate-binding protein n=1 Tax=Burkholderia sp. WP9 TaxID=1500263 RepID=UPI0008970561|nr:ABC transporter substrate-binding protein [Burkholderia sp. WP9]SEF14165.1 putative spermidine/putrescine transport system substrate-binding protein [Burkholderia sp. WP9]
MDTCLRIICTAAFAVVASVAHADTTLYVGGYGGSTEKLFDEKLIPQFERNEKGVKVVYVAGNSTDTLAKVAAQKGRQELSVVIIDDGPMYQAVEQGLCAPLEQTGPIKDLYPLAHMAGDRAVGIGMLATGLVYNKAAFAKHGWVPPTSWNDLTDPKYREKVVVPPISNGYGLLTLLMMARLNGGGENNIDPGFQIMTNKVAPNVLTWEPSPGKMAQMLQTGEATLAVWGNGRVQDVINQGAPLAFVYPKEGAVALMAAACPIAGAPQPALAQRFVQFVVSPEAQTLLATDAGFGPVNKTVTLPPAIAAKVVSGPEKVKALISPNYQVINAKRAEWTARWDRSVER